MKHCTTGESYTLSGLDDDLNDGRQGIRQGAIAGWIRAGLVGRGRNEEQGRLAQYESERHGRVEESKETRDFILQA